MTLFCGFNSLVTGMPTIIRRLLAVLACSHSIALRLKPVQGAVLAVAGGIIPPAYSLAQGVYQVRSVPGSCVPVLARPNAIHGGLPSGSEGR